MALLMTVAFPGLFGFGGLMVWRGARIGGSFALAPALAWPALFLSLGWNFLESGFAPVGGDSWAWGWLLCGVVFVIMGGAPLLFVLRTDGVVRRPAPGTGPWLAAVALAVVVGVGLGYAVYRFFAG